MSGFVVTHGDERGGGGVVGTAESVIPATYVAMATSGSPARKAPLSADRPDPSSRVYVCSPGRREKWVAIRRPHSKYRRDSYLMARH